MFTNYFIKKKIEALVSQTSNRESRSISIDEASSILLFYDFEDLKSVRNLIEPLVKAGKNITSCVYIRSRNVKLPTFDSFIPIGLKGDLNAWGFPSEAIIEKVNSIKADILIDITRPACYPLEYLAVSHKCKFKVGVKYPDQEWYDLSVSVTDKDDIEYLFGQILFYLRSIRSK